MAGKETAAKANITQACTSEKKLKNYKKKKKRKVGLRFEDSEPPPHYLPPHGSRAAIELVCKLLGWVVAIFLLPGCISSLFLPDGPGS